MAVCVGLGTALAFSTRPESVPLWPGARFSYQDRSRAIERGMRFIYKAALDPKDFSTWGHDLLWCFYTISSSAQDPGIRQLAWQMGHERALEWRRQHLAVAPDSPAADIANLIIGSDSAAQLGVPGNEFKAQLRRAAARFSSTDYVLFDPAREPPPSDVPDACSRCGKANPRGSKTCGKCGSPLAMRSRYDLWCDALINAHSGDHYGITLGSHLADAVRWLPAMRPYAPLGNTVDDGFSDAFYSITHLVYTLNDYNQWLIAPRCLPQEYDVLKTSLTNAFKAGDPDMLGEYMDSLKAFGLTTRDPLIRQGEEFLLSTQNPDGSWGDMKATDIYDRYHPTWTAVDGLRDYSYRGYIECPPQ